MMGRKAKTTAETTTGPYRTPTKVERAGRLEAAFAERIADARKDMNRVVDSFMSSLVRENDRARAIMQAITWKTDEIANVQGQADVMATALDVWRGDDAETSDPSTDADMANASTIPGLDAAYVGAVADRMRNVLVWAKSESDIIMRNPGWQMTSSNVVANVIECHRLAGRSVALYQLAKLAESELRRIDEAPDAE